MPVHGSAVAATVSVARAAGPPRLLEGLWEISVHSTENPGGKETEYSFRLCRDHAFDKQTDELVKNNKNCATNCRAWDADRFSGGVPLHRVRHRHRVERAVRLSEDTAVHSESAATYTPPLYGKTDETMVQDQRYLGNCPAGMKPGDRILADGSLVRRAK